MTTRVETVGGEPASSVPAPGLETVTPSTEVVETPTQSLQITPKPAVVEDQGERPAWLPAKFKNVDEFVKSHSELEKKLGTPPPAKTEETPPATGLTETEFAAFGREVVETGDLSEASYKALEAKGIPKSMVAQYVADRKAESSAVVNSAIDAAGGPERYQAIAEWAAENVDEGQLTAYNAAVRSGDPSQIQFAVAGMAAQYNARNADGQRRAAVAPLMGRKVTQSSVKPYSSKEEMVRDMRQPLYKNDPGFREKVEFRIAATPDGVL